MLRWVVIAARGARRGTSGKMLPFRTLVSSPKDPGAGHEGVRGADPPLGLQAEPPPPKDTAHDSAEKDNSSWDAKLGPPPCAEGGGSPKDTAQDSAAHHTARWDAKLGAPPRAEGGGSETKIDPDHGASSEAYEAASMAFEDEAGGRTRLRRPGKGEELYGEGAARMASMRDSGALYFRDKYAQTSKAVAVLIRKKLQPSVDAAVEYVNERSGWAEVERLKGAISTLELDLREAQAAHREVREQLKMLQDQHRRSQVEMDTLLVTKHMWSEHQLHQYKKLLEEERNNSAAMQALEAAYGNTEHKVDRSLNSLMEGLRKRFHEEQLWTDRIRQLSTWSTIAILMANSLIFMFSYLLRWREVNNVRTAVKQIREDVKKQDLASKSMCAQVEEMNQHLQHMEHLLDRNQHRWRAHSSSAARAAPDPEAWEDGQGGLSRKQKTTLAVWFAGTTMLAVWVIGRHTVSA